MKTKERLEVEKRKNELKYKEFYYYDRTKLYQQTICIILADTGEISKGIAFCSTKDVFDKNKGRAIAKGRALKALYRREHNGTIKAFPLILYEIFVHKSIYNPVLTEFEVNILSKRKS